MRKRDELKVELADKLIEYVKLFPQSTIAKACDGDAEALVAVRDAIKRLNNVFDTVNVRDVEQVGSGHPFAKSGYHHAVTLNGMALGYFQTEKLAREYIDFKESTL